VIWNTHFSLSGIVNVPLHSFFERLSVCILIMKDDCSSGGLRDVFKPVWVIKSSLVINWDVLGVAWRSLDVARGSICVFSRGQIIKIRGFREIWRFLFISSQES